jgi:hypothetical protein
MLRNISGSLLALIGAVLAVWNPFRVWYGGRPGARIRVDGLFTGAGVTPDDAALLGSLFLPMGFAALLALLGVLMRSRLAVGAAGVLVLGVTVLWMVRQGQSAGSLTAGGDGMDVGVAAAVAAGALLLLAAAVLPPRSGSRKGYPAPPAYAPDAGVPAAPPEPALPPVPPGPPVPPVDGDTLTLPPPGWPLSPDAGPEPPPGGPDPAPRPR